MDPNQLFASSSENDPFSSSARVATQSTSLEHQQRYNPEDGCLYSMYKKMECDEKGCQQQLEHFRQCPNKPMEKLETDENKQSIWHETNQKPPSIPGIAFNVSFNPIRMFQNLSQSAWGALGYEPQQQLPILTPGGPRDPRSSPLTSPPAPIATPSSNTRSPTVFGDVITSLQAMDREMTAMFERMDRSFQYQYPPPKLTPSNNNEDQDKSLKP